MAILQKLTILNAHGVNNKSASFIFKEKLVGKTVADGAKDVEIMVPLKYLSNFWRTLGMLLINCEISFILTWCLKCVVSNDVEAITFEITDRKFYVPVVT